MKRRKLLGDRAKIYRCKECGNISTSAEKCPRCGASYHQELAKKAWEQQKEYGPETKDGTLDGTTTT